MGFLFIFCLFVFEARSHYVALIGLEFRDPSASQVMGLKVCAATRTNYTLTCYHGFVTWLVLNSTISEDQQADYMNAPDM